MQADREELTRLNQALRGERGQLMDKLLDATRIRHEHVHSPRQLTDLYLLALAVHRGGRLVTFDQRIAISAVPMAGAEHLVVL